MKSLLQEKLLLYNVQRKKDPDSFAQLYDTYITRVYRFVYFKVSNREEAEDITSDVFLKAWHYITDPTKKDVDSFSGLVYRIARTTIIDHYRSTAKRQTSTLDGIDIPDTASIEALHNKADAAQIMVALRSLKQEYQEVILLKYIEQYSTAEIAKILEKKATNVRVTLHRALKLLKKTLEG